MKRYKHLTDEVAFSIATSIVSQAVKDAQADLRRLYRKPDDAKAWSRIKRDIIPFFSYSVFCPVSARVMMEHTIEQLMQMQGLTEMPEAYRKALALAA